MIERPTTDMPRARSIRLSLPAFRQDRQERGARRPRRSRHLPPLSCPMTESSTGDSMLSQPRRLRAAESIRLPRMPWARWNGPPLARRRLLAPNESADRFSSQPSDKQFRNVAVPLLDSCCSIAIDNHPVRSPLPCSFAIQPLMYCQQWSSDTPSFWQRPKKRIDSRSTGVSSSRSSTIVGLLSSM